jgi:hypothetical protein
VFAPFGPVADIIVKKHIFNADPQQVSGYAFVYFYAMESAMRSISALKGVSVENVHFDCSLAGKKREHHHRHYPATKSVASATAMQQHYQQMLSMMNGNQHNHHGSNGSSSIVTMMSSAMSSSPFDMNMPQQNVSYNNKRSVPAATNHRSMSMQSTPPNPNHYYQQHPATVAGNQSPAWQSQGLPPNTHSHHNNKHMSEFSSQRNQFHHMQGGISSTSGRSVVADLHNRNYFYSNGQDLQNYNTNSNFPTMNAFSRDFNSFSNMKLPEDISPLSSITNTATGANTTTSVESSLTSSVFLLPQSVNRLHHQSSSMTAAAKPPLCPPGRNQSQHHNQQMNAEGEWGSGNNSFRSSAATTPNSMFSDEDNFGHTNTFLNQHQSNSSQQRSVQHSDNDSLYGESSVASSLTHSKGSESHHSSFYAIKDLGLFSLSHSMAEEEKFPFPTASANIPATGHHDRLFFALSPEPELVNESHNGY